MIKYKTTEDKLIAKELTIRRGKLIEKDKLTKDINRHEKINMFLNGIELKRKELRV